MCFYPLEITLERRESSARKYDPFVCLIKGGGGGGMTPRIVGFFIDFHMQLHDSPTARSRKQALAEQWNARIVWEIRTVIGGQHLHTWPASYLVIAAVISACPLSRHFYDKGCTPLLPRMKLRRSIACVHTPPPIPPPSSVVESRATGRWTDPSNGFIRWWRTIKLPRLSKRASESSGGWNMKEKNQDRKISRK